MSASMSHVCCVRLQNLLRVQALIRSNVGQRTKLCHKIRSCTSLNQTIFTTARHDLQNTGDEANKKTDTNENDFFGIDILEKNVQTVETKSLEKDEIYRKHEFCSDRNSEVYNELHDIGQPKLITLPFGAVRIDKPRTKTKKRKSVIDKENERTLENDQISLIENSEQNDGHTMENQREKSFAESDICEKSDLSGSSDFIEKQYFGDYIKENNSSISETVITSNESLIKNSEKCTEIQTNGDIADKTTLNFIDQQYFQDPKIDPSISNQLSFKSETVEKDIIFKELKSHDLEKIPTNGDLIKTEDTNFIDQQYFQESAVLGSADDNSESKQLKKINYSLSSLDQNLMPESIQKVNVGPLKNTKLNSTEIETSKVVEDATFVNNVKSFSSKLEKEKRKTSSLESAFECQNNKPSESRSSIQIQGNTHELLEEEGCAISSENQHHSISAEKLREKKKWKTMDDDVKGVEKTKEENPNSAYAVAMKIRKEKSFTDGKLQTPRLIDGKLVDSKGYRILKDQVQDLSKLTAEEVTDILYANIIYDRDDIIAINKPYGLASQGGTGIRVSVAHLLEPLAKKIDKKLETLHIVHRLDQETTGVMLLAKTPQIAALLKSAFKNRKVNKVYWVIVKGVPNPKEGKIVIPMAEGSVDGRKRMVLRPDSDDPDVKLVMKKSSIETHEAITNYKVIKSKDTTALVECRPETGVKHQIRIHLAWGLGTPILGDHKYTYVNKMVPQKLSSEMLQRLRIQQSKVRYVPMHLHAKSILIPEFLNGQNLSISCKLPPHFAENMKKLKLKP